MLNWDAWDVHIVSFESEDKYKEFTNACVGSFAWGGTSIFVQSRLGNKRNVYYASLKSYSVSMLV